ncbi:MAG: DNA-formamidopyrimidine glycosylase [Verrucomicrobia bacterium]|nr:DNA-formamidopyrimidine glycosylase [Verrucomicrobiota bacterium]
MPELPEVETVVRGLVAAELPGCRIVRASVSWPRIVSGCTPAQFRSRLKNCTIASVGRRGKFIVVGLKGPFDLLIHLRMTGQLAFADPSEKRSPHHHIALLLNDGRELRYKDTRKFGRWMLLDDVQRKLGSLGPEPLERSFTPNVLTACLHGRKRMLKPLLLDQHIVAGLGNIYVDEALWDAELHPCATADALHTADLLRLHRAIQRVLRQGVRAMGTTLGTGSTNFYSVAGRRGRNQDGLKVFRRTGEPCPRCDKPIERLVVAQRSTHICPACQRFR